jgi:nicotinamide mononucleotide adenylyltransferase
MAASKPNTSRERTRAYRERLRAKGLKPVTIWVPDLNNPEIRKRIAEGCRQLDQSADEQEVLALIDSLVDEQLRAINELERE